MLRPISEVQLKLSSRLPSGDLRTITGHRERCIATADCDFSVVNSRPNIITIFFVQFG